MKLCDQVGGLLFRSQQAEADLCSNAFGRLRCASCADGIVEQPEGDQNVAASRGKSVAISKAGLCR